MQEGSAKVDSKIKNLYNGVKSKEGRTRMTLWIPALFFLTASIVLTVFRIVFLFAEKKVRPDRRVQRFVRCDVLFGYDKVG